MRTRLAAALLLLCVVPAGRSHASPNVVLFLADDMGFSDLASYGGEISTPTLDRLAAGGVRFSQFYVTPRCSPTRAALLTGRTPHAAGVGWLADLPSDHPAYRGAIRPEVATLPERLKEAGYRSYAVGKWHLDPALDAAGPDAPLARGFERYFGVLRGADDLYRPESLARDRVRLDPPDSPFYLTDALSEEAAGYVRDHARDTPGQPFFLYVAFTAPHWPVQAPAEDIALHAGRYSAGWDAVRSARSERLGELGVLSASWSLAPRDPKVPAWAEGGSDQAWQRARMRAYAGMVHRMDRGIATVLAAIEEAGAAHDTLLLFLSDNGGSPETLSPASRRLREVAGFWTPEHYGDDPAVEPGGPDSFQSYGRAWSNLSNAPFRGHKAGLLEGGIASPLIVRWPAGLAAAPGSWVRGPAHVTDLAATVLELAGLAAPGLDGESLTPLLRGATRERGPMFWEHEGWRAVRAGDLKLVTPWGGLRNQPRWELYDLAADRTESRDLAAQRPDDVARLAALWADWARRAGVEPWPWALTAVVKLATGALAVSILVVAVVLWWLHPYVRRVSSKRT